MVMGDTVLFEDEVNAAMTAALDNGLSVTALHNHFFLRSAESFLHAHRRRGHVEQLASAVRKVYDEVKAGPRRESAAEGIVRRKTVAGEKFDFSGAAERNFRTSAARRTTEW